MTTQSQYPLRVGEWVYLTEEIGAYPIGMYGKYICHTGIVQVQIQTPLNEILFVHPSKLNKLSAEIKQFGENDTYVLLESLGDFPAGTSVHFVCGLGGSEPTCFTDDGAEVFSVRLSILLHVVTEEENPVIWHIQQSLLKATRRQRNVFFKTPMVE